MLGCVEIRPEVELVVSLSDPDHLGQVAGFEPGLKLETVGQRSEVDLGVDRGSSGFRGAASP